MGEIVVSRGAENWSKLNTSGRLGALFCGQPYENASPPGGAGRAFPDLCWGVAAGLRSIPEPPYDRSPGGVEHRRDSKQAGTTKPGAVAGAGGLSGDQNVSPGIPRLPWLPG